MLIEEPVFMTDDQQAMASEGFCPKCRAPLVPPVPDSWTIMTLASDRVFAVLVSMCSSCTAEIVVQYRRLP